MLIQAARSSFSPQLEKLARWAVRMSLVLGLLGLSGCSVLKDFQAAQARSKEEKAVAAFKKEADQRHAEFRAQTGWKKKTYRDDQAMERLTPETAKIVIDLSDQRGLLTWKEIVVMDFPVATGRKAYPTPAGDFKILSKERIHSSNLYGKIYDAEGNVVDSDADIRTDAVPEGGSFAGAPMPYWMRLTPTGVGLHVGYVPGRPASHGCIRMPSKIAPTVYNSVKVGTPVTVQP